VHLLCVATLTPRKGHETLFRALAAVRWLDWRLTCVGSLDKDQATTARLRGLLHESRLDERVVLAGEMQPARLAAEFDVADVFVLPTLYEGYGMAVAEAIARGIPVVGTATGAIPDLVEASGYTTAPSGATLQSRGEAAGILVPPGDVAALADVLSAIISDGQLRARLASGARGRRERLPSWAAASSKMAEALQRVHR
jgi:glycosyltransferase involved in cell wall biosynthesis